MIIYNSGSTNHHRNSAHISDERDIDLKQTVGYHNLKNIHECELYTMMRIIVKDKKESPLVPRGN